MCFSALRKWGKVVLTRYSLGSKKREINFQIDLLAKSYNHFLLNHGLMILQRKVITLDFPGQ